jgi:putative membrane protein
MFKSRFIGAALLGLASASLPLAATATMSMNSQDSTLVTDAGQAGTAEVQLAAPALEKSSNPHVISFAKEMRADHRKANAHLMPLLQAQSVTPAAGAGAKNAALTAQLKTQTGSAFDSHYLKSQLPAHQQVLALFQAEAADGSDSKLFAFAKQTIPVIQSRIAMDKRDIAALGSGAMSMRMPEQK